MSSHKSSFTIQSSSISIALALVWAGPAFSQGQAAQGGSPAEEASVKNSDIVVTAQRRSQNLQDVPASVTAIQPGLIENANIARLDAIATVSPGLVFSSGFGFPSPVIRGIGVDKITPGLEGAVSLYIDGASTPRGQGTLINLVDIGSIEVLKGPQGTLYGRNASGGAILVNTANPTDILEGSATLEYGRFNHGMLEAVMNVPASDTLSFRFAANYTREDGYIDNLTTGRKVAGFERYLVRAKVKWDPTPDLSAVLTLERAKETGEMPTSFRHLLTNNLCAPCRAGANVTTGFYQVRSNYRGPEHTDSNSATLRLSYDADQFQIRTVSSYRDINAVASYDIDWSPLALLEQQQEAGGKTYYQDIQVSSTFKGMFNFLLGGEYIYDNSPGVYTLQGTAIGLPIAPYPGVVNRVKTDSYAVFAEAYIKPVERLTITLGGRYLHDHRSISSVVEPRILAIRAPGGPAAFAQKVGYSKFTPRAVVAYDAGIVNLYASYTQGFRAGGFKTPAYTIQTTPIRPEKITSYEVGAKFVSPNRRVRLNLSAFHYDYTDVQVSSVAVAGGPGITTNAAKIRGRGVEMDLHVSANDWLTLSSGLAYLDAKFVDYRNAPFLAVVRDAAGLPLRYAGGVVADLSGDRPVRSPKWSGYASADIKVPVGNDFVGRLSGTVNYTSGYDYYPGGGSELDLDKSKSLALVNMSGGVGPSSGAYEVGFYIDNLTNHKYYLVITTTSNGTAGQAAKPRAIGARIKVRI